MLWILLIIVCLISAFTRVFERSAGLLAFLLMGYMVGTPNYQFNNDAFVYLNSYLSKADNFERGYNWLTDLAATHVSYATFRLYSSITVYILMFLVILIFTKHVSSVALFYAFAMFPFDSEQIRSGMATLFILFGAWMLVKFQKKGVFPALIIIICGSLFHSLALIFIALPLLWLIRKNVKNHFKLYFICISVISFLFEILGSSSLVPVISDLTSKISSRTQAALNISTVYNSGSVSLKIWITFYLITLFFVLSGYSLKLRDKNPDSYFDLFLCSMILWGVSLTLLTVSVDYVRILRIAIFSYILLITNRITIGHKWQGKLYLFLISGALLLMIIQIKSYGINSETMRSLLGFN